MGLTNPSLALRRFCYDRKLLALSGTLAFSTNIFRPVSLLALLVGFNLSLLIGVLSWFFKIPKIVSLEFVEVFRKDPFFGPLFSLFINDLPASLPSSVSCSLYADDLAIQSSSPSVPTMVEATQEALIQSERWS